VTIVSKEFTDKTEHVEEWYGVKYNLKVIEPSRITVSFNNGINNTRRNVARCVLCIILSLFIGMEKLWYEPTATITPGL